MLKNFDTCAKWVMGLSKIYNGVFSCKLSHDRLFFYHGDMEGWCIEGVDEHTYLSIQCTDTIEPIPAMAGNLEYLIGGAWLTFEQVMSDAS